MTPGELAWQIRYFALTGEDPPALRRVGYESRSFART